CASLLALRNPMGRWRNSIDALRPSIGRAALLLALQLDALLVIVLGDHLLVGDLLDGDDGLAFLVVPLHDEGELVAIDRVGALATDVLVLDLGLDLDLAVLGELDGGADGRTLVEGLGHLPGADEQLGVVLLLFLVFGPHAGGQSDRHRSGHHQSSSVHPAVLSERGSGPPVAGLRTWASAWPVAFPGRGRF